MENFRKRQGFQYKLFIEISLYLKGRKSGIHAIQTNLLEFDWRNNDEYFPGSSDFLFWKYYADIETQVSDEANYIQCVNLILFLKSKHIDTIAVCNFENELFSSYANPKIE